MINSKRIDKVLAQKDAARKKRLNLEYKALDKVLNSDELQNKISEVLDLTIEATLNNLSGKPFIMFSSDIDKATIVNWVLAKDHATFSKYKDDINKRISKLIAKNMHRRSLTQKSVQLESGYGHSNYKIWITKKHEFSLCFWPSFLFLSILLLVIFYISCDDRFVSKHSVTMLLIVMLIVILMIVDLCWFVGKNIRLEQQVQWVLADKYDKLNDY